MIKSLSGDLFRNMLFIALPTVCRYGLPTACKFSVLRLCDMFFFSSFNHFALLLIFLTFSQILFQNSPILCLIVI